MWRYFIKVLVQKEIYPYYGGFVIIYDLRNDPEFIELIRYCQQQRTLKGITASHETFY